MLTMSRLAHTEVKKLADIVSSGTLTRDSGHAWVVAVTLTFANMCSYVDRQIINLLVDPIKFDLRLTDTKMSLLQGVAVYPRQRLSPTSQVWSRSSKFLD